MSTIKTEEQIVHYVLGGTLKEMIRQLGGNRSTDNDGEAIRDGEMYEISSLGIERMK